MIFHLSGREFGNDDGMTAPRCITVPKSVRLAGFTGEPSICRIFPRMAVAANPVDPYQINSPDTRLDQAPINAKLPFDPWPRPYILSDGLRRVAPYHFTYNTFCKERWRGREILDIFACEFRDRTREYYKNAIETGQIAINGKACEDVKTIVKNGDVISHTLHRHEPPVTAQPIRVISETDSMIVIDKPAGVPVHPAGRYKHNSVVEIMRAERHSAFNPLPCNRLDRLTSGVMFIGKEKKEAEVIGEKLRSRTMRKEYVARVKGKFPDDGGSKVSACGVVTCDENILQISPILGLNRVRASGKTAKTLFKRIAYYPPKRQRSDGSSAAVQSTKLSSNAIPIKNPRREESDTHSLPPPTGETSDGYSIVHCLPLTGRTHQIRVHLQYLGHPIINDPIYANRRVFGSKLAVHDSSSAQDEEIKRRLANMGKTEVASAIDYDNSVEQTLQTCLPPESQPLSGGPKKTDHGGLPFSSPAEFDSFVAQHDAMVADYNKRKGERMTGEKCAECDTPLYSDPGPQELGIYLHALSYSDQAGEWEFRSEIPDWALPPSGESSAHGDNKAIRIETIEKLGRGWVYDGSENPPVEVDTKALNREGMRRNKRGDGNP